MQVVEGAEDRAPGDGRDHLHLVEHAQLGHPGKHTEVEEGRPESSAGECQPQPASGPRDRGRHCRTHIVHVPPLVGRPAILGPVARGSRLPLPGCTVQILRSAPVTSRGPRYLARGGPTPRLIAEGATAQRLVKAQDDSTFPPPPGIANPP